MNGELETGVQVCGNPMRDETKRDLDPRELKHQSALYVMEWLSAALSTNNSAEAIKQRATEEAENGSLTYGQAAQVSAMLRRWRVIPGHDVHSRQHHDDPPLPFGSDNLTAEQQSVA